MILNIFITLASDLGIIADIYTQNIEIYIYPKRFNFNMKSKRGEGKGTIAPLILLITLLLVLYVIMLPEDLRNELLDEPNDGVDIDNLTGTTPRDNSISDAIINEEILLRKNPGRLDKLDFRQVKNTLPAVSLFSETSDEEFAYSRNIYVENSLFSEIADKMSFKLDNPSNHKNLLLSFNANQRSGRLVITLNGQVIFNDELTQPTVEPIKLSVGMLQNDNLLEFRVSSAGGRFWRTNSYALDNVKVTGQEIDTSTLGSSTNFVVLDDDWQNTETVLLRFIPECNQANVGRLDVSINAESVFSQVPVCGDLQAIEFAKDRLKVGNNQLSLKSSSGKYIVDGIEIIQSLRQPTNPTYYFEMDTEEIKDLLRLNDIALNLYLQFADDEFHNLDVFVNGHVIHIDEKKNRFVWNIEPFLFAGTNAIKLIPRSKDIDVVEMVLQFEKIR